MLNGQEGVLGAALGAGTLFLVFGTSAPSYVKTAFHKVRQNVKESVDPQFEIDRARQDDRKPEADVRSEQGNAGPRRGRGRKPREAKSARCRPTWSATKKTILSMQHKLKTGDFRLTGHVTDTRG